MEKGKYNRLNIFLLFVLFLQILLLSKVPAVLLFFWKDFQIIAWRKEIKRKNQRKIIGWKVSGEVLFFQKIKWHILTYSDLKIKKQNIQVPKQTNCQCLSLWRHRAWILQAWVARGPEGKIHSQQVFRSTHSHLLGN